VVAVDTGTIEEVGMLDEKDAGSGARGSGLVHPRPFGVTTERDRERHPRALERGRGLAHQLVQRHEDRGGMTGRSLERRETAHRLAQPAGASEGPILGRQVRAPDPLALGRLGPRRRARDPSRTRGALPAGFRRWCRRAHAASCQAGGGAAADAPPRIAGRYYSVRLSLPFRWAVNRAPAARSACFIVSTQPRGTPSASRS